ncbi:MAG TPA: large-conductance mechanosensitive channel protein MscL [Pirellulales bacterium]|jgi:large conductance mechanosensitive channel|nr:large-conductance mechanosensitive channel protein MscL [Pirellulales bacterium]
MLKEFKEFALKGNVVDMAVGIIIGGAFGKIVTSLVNDVIMPPIGMLIGSLDFSKLSIELGEGPAPKFEPVVLRYGAFLNAVVDFLIVAFCIFLVVRQMNQFTRKLVPQGAPPTKECPRCATPIPFKAVRCPHCTSELTAQGEPNR